MEKKLTSGDVELGKFQQTLYLHLEVSEGRREEEKLVRRRSSLGTAHAIKSAVCSLHQSDEVLMAQQQESKGKMFELA